MLRLYLVLILIFISGCVTQSDINKSINLGLEYLDKSYDSFNYDDPYLEFVYPDENLDCNIENCELTYRKMDAYFNVYFIKNEFEDYSIINEQIKDADLIFENIIQDWRDGEIYNARKSNGEGFALDTYCIFSYVTKDEKMNEVIVDYIDEDEWGIDVDSFGDDKWRVIADETWCSRALMNTETSEIIDPIVKKQIENTKKFISINNNWDNFGVIYHILFVLNDYENKYDGKFNVNRDEFVEEIVLILNDSDELLVKINALDILSRIYIEDKNLLFNLKENIIKEQREDGSWDLSNVNNVAPVFTTFRGVIALNSYKNEIEN